MTKSGVVVLLLAGGLAVPVYAKKKKDAPLPQLFCQAQFVYVQAFDGDINNPYLLPADRDAAEALEQRLQDWHRYTLVMNRYEADLVFTVRTGRAASAGNGPYPGGGPGIGAPGQVPGGGQVRVPMGGPGPYPQENPGAQYPGGQNPGGQNPGAQNPGSGPYPGGQGGPGGMPGPVGPGEAGAEMGPPNDWMAIYMKPVEGSQTGPIWERSEKDGLQGSMPLFLQIKNAVDKQCITQPGAGRTGGAPPGF